MNIPQELIDMISSSQNLQNIIQIHTCKDASDASAAMNEGAVLLGVAPINDDHEGDGFRCLIGLPDDVILTPYLENFFPRN